MCLGACSSPGKLEVIVMNHRDRDPRDRINKNERRYNNDQDKRSRSKSPSNQSRTNSRDLITTNSKDNNRWDDPMKQFSEVKLNILTHLSIFKF